jgi:hypothetical protein
MKGNSGNCQHCKAVLVTQVRPRRQSQPKFKSFAKYKEEVREKRGSRSDHADIVLAADATTQDG